MESFRETLRSNFWDCGSPSREHQKGYKYGCGNWTATGEQLRCAVADDASESTETAQLHRLASWGTYATHDDKKKRKPASVQFAYPPISSLKEVPRMAPEELDALFFTTEELDLYEQDRRQTTTVDDVEIVAVSTSSLSADENEFNSFGGYVPTPKKPRGRQLARERPRRKLTPHAPRKTADGRLLKSVQIFLRERSTGA